MEGDNIIHKIIKYVMHNMIYNVMHYMMYNLRDRYEDMEEEIVKNCSKKKLEKC